MGIKLGEEQLEYMALFEGISGAPILDCIIPDDANRVVFVVKKNNVSKAIGRGGLNVKKAKNMIGRDIEVVEYSEDPKEFITKLVSPARVQNIRLVESEGNKTAYVNVHPQDKGMAIGRGGSTIRKVRTLSDRHHSIDNVVVV